MELSDLLDFLKNLGLREYVYIYPNVVNRNELVKVTKEPKVIMYDVDFEGDKEFNKYVEDIYDFLVEVGISYSDDIIYAVLCHREFLNREYIIVIPNKENINSDFFNIVTNKVCEYHKNRLLKNILYDVPINITVNINTPDLDEMNRLYYKYIQDRINSIVMYFTDYINKMHKKAFIQAFKIMQKYNNVKIVKTGFILTTDIVPRYIKIHSRIYSIPASISKKYTYKGVGVYLKTTPNLNVKSANIYSSKYKYIIHPQIKNNQICLGDMSEKDVFYVMENLKNMLELWNIDSGFAEPCDYLLKKVFKCDSWSDVAEKLKLIESTDDIW